MGYILRPAGNFSRVDSPEYALGTLGSVMKTSELNSCIAIIARGPNFLGVIHLSLYAPGPNGQDVIFDDEVTDQVMRLLLPHNLTEIKIIGHIVDVWRLNIKADYDYLVTRLRFRAPVQQCPSGVNRSYSVHWSQNSLHVSPNVPSQILGN